VVRLAELLVPVVLVIPLVVYQESQLVVLHLQVVLALVHLALQNSPYPLNLHYHQSHCLYHLHKKGFKLDPINVISVLEGNIISAKSTDQSIVFERAKAKSSTDSLFELQKINKGFSIAGLAPGVYN
jgi:hypothetical protein